MFGLSQKAQDQAQLLSILRDRLYSNKVLAVLREYGTNAWDAHVDAKKEKVPINIRLPTLLDPTLVIRDYGKGLSEEDVYEVYTKYGASTKRDSNKSVGMFGIGCKSAFAYSDSFTVTSHHNETKKVYIAALDPSNIGKMTKQYEGPTNETGIEIRIPVNPKDEAQFHLEAKRLYPFFNPQPVINIKLAEIKAEALETPDGFLLKKPLEGLNPWTARMGCIPYRLDLSAIGIAQYPELSTFTRTNFGCLYFRLGEVDISASREELEYTDRTKKAIKRKLLSLRESQTEAVDKRLLAMPSNYHRRLEARLILAKTGVRPSKEFEHFVDFRVEIYKVERTREETVDPTTGKQEIQVVVRREPTKFTLRKWVTEYKRFSSQEVSTIEMSRPRFWYNDEKDSRRLKYYKDIVDTSDVFIVEPQPGHSKEDVLAEFTTFLKRACLDGEPVPDVTSSYYNPPAPKKIHKIAAYRSTIFKWKGGDRESSDSWEIYPDEMKQTDVYVVIERFHPREVTLKTICRDLRMFRELDPFQPFPTLLGIKTTETKPVKVDELPGISYNAWKVARLRELLAQHEDLASTFEGYLQHRTLGMLSVDREQMKTYRAALGRQHKIVELLDRVTSFSYLINDMSCRNVNYSKSYLTKMHFIREGLREYIDEDFGQRMLNTISDRYPLLSRSPNNFAQELSADRQAAWIQYFQLIDKAGD